MSRRQIVAQGALPPQPVLADANYTCSALDTSVTAMAAGLTLTLPQNPSPGLTIVDFLAGFAFTLTGGAFSPLTPSDPITVPVGSTGFAAYSAAGWEIVGLGTTGGGTVTSVTASSPLASSGGATPNISIATPVPVADGGTGVATLAAHGVLVGEGAGNVVALGAGTAGQVLTSNGATADPSMQALPASVTAVSGTAPIVSSGGATPAISLTAPSRAFGTNGAPVTLTAAAQIVASANFTPRTSGKVTIHVTGVVDNNDSTTTSRPVILTLSHGAGATPADFTQATLRMTGNQEPASQFGATVPLDLLAAPVTFVVGIAAQINANLTGDGSGQLVLPTGGVQLTVEEAIE